MVFRGVVGVSPIIWAIFVKVLSSGAGSSMHAAKIQLAPVDVCSWEQDALFGVFPQGARAKLAYLSPEDVTDAFLIPQHRYLFKRSKNSYPDQFWGEVVAYRIGQLVGVDVPPAFAAMDSTTGISAALIEWFYKDGAETFSHAGDFLPRIRPGFDRERGADHNLADCQRLLDAWARARRLQDDWTVWWGKALVFDALIGNTDRHQDNWGLIFTTDKETKTRLARLSPYFDNGTSLGHERFTERVAGWGGREFDMYLSKGKHHVRWAHKDEGSRSHFDLVARFAEKWPTARPAMRDMLSFSDEELHRCAEDLLELKLTVPLSVERLGWMMKLTLLRRQRLIEALV